MNEDIFDLTDLGETPVRIPWSPDTDDLHMNVVVLRPGEEIAQHTNHALDVIVTCLQGDGTITIAGDDSPLRPGTIALIRRGSERRIVAGDAGITYTTVHRRRGGLMPTVAND